jgi:DNA helicase HerA-like ATPase
MANLQWRQGEHSICLGPTGKGKSTLVRNLLKYREQRNAHVLVIATKSANSFEQLTPGRTVFKSQLDEHPRGYYLTKSWRKAKNGDYERVLLWVRYTGQESIGRQKREIDAAMQDVMSQGGWTVYIDELRWFTDRLKLSDWVTDAWTQGREIKVSLIGSSQRPAWITRDIYANSTHFYIWSTQDKEDLDRLSGIGGMDSRLIRQAVAELEGHDVLYINAYEKVLYVTRAPAPSKET